MSKATPCKNPEMSFDVRGVLRGLEVGDPAVLEALYYRYAPRLLRRLRQRYPYLEPEDLLQDAFVRYLRNDAALLRRFSEAAQSGSDVEAKFERYLWDHACGVAANARRRAGNRPTERLKDETTGRPPVTPERTSLSRDLLQKLDLCLESKGTRLYLYFRLRYHQGWTPREISEMTGWSMKITYRLKQHLDEAVRDCSRHLDIGLSP